MIEELESSRTFAGALDGNAFAIVAHLLVDVCGPIHLRDELSPPSAPGATRNSRSKGAPHNQQLPCRFQARMSINPRCGCRSLPYRVQPPRDSRF